MELNSVQNQIVAPIVQGSIVALKHMAHSEAWAGNEFQDSVWTFRFNGFALVAELNGAMNGVVLFHHYLETALALGKRVLEFVHDEHNEVVGLTEHVQDALIEFSDKVLAQAAQGLKQSGLQLDIKPSFPIVNTQNIGDLLINVEEIISVPLHVDTIGRHYINFFIKDHHGIN